MILYTAKVSKEVNRKCLLETRRYRPWRHNAQPYRRQQTEGHDHANSRSYCVQQYDRL